jgi:hypothetical protein
MVDVTYDSVFLPGLLPQSLSMDGWSACLLSLPPCFQNIRSPSVHHFFHGGPSETSNFGSGGLSLDHHIRLVVERIQDYRLEKGLATAAI